MSIQFQLVLCEGAVETSLPMHFEGFQLFKIVIDYDSDLLP